MDPLTKADLKQLLQELKEDIKVSVASELNNWKPGIETQLTHLHTAVEALQQHVFHNPNSDTGEASVTVLSAPSVRKDKPSMAKLPVQETPWASGHGVDTTPRTVVNGAGDPSGQRYGRPPEFPIL